MTTLLTEVSNSGAIDRISVFGGTDGDAASSYVTVVIECTFPDVSEPAALTADEYPVLAAIWDNEDDAVYDDL